MFCLFVRIPHTVLIRIRCQIQLIYLCERVLWWNSWSVHICEWHRSTTCCNYYSCYWCVNFAGYYCAAGPGLFHLHPQKGITICIFLKIIIMPSKPRKELFLEQTLLSNLRLDISYHFYYWYVSSFDFKKWSIKTTYQI